MNYVDFIDCALDEKGRVISNVVKGVRKFLKCCGMHDLVVPLKTAKNKLFWGTYGSPAEHPVRWVRLMDCTTDHLCNILSSQQLPTSYTSVIDAILVDRHKRR